ENATKWTKVDEKALAVILLNVHKTQLNLVKRAATSKEAWENLKKVHKFRGSVRRAALLKQLYRMKKGTDQTMSQFSGNCYICKKYGYRASNCRYKNANTTQKQNDALTATVFKNDSRKLNVWYQDSGATTHKATRKIKSLIWTSNARRFNKAITNILRLLAEANMPNLLTKANMPKLLAKSEITRLYTKANMLKLLTRANMTKLLTKAIS
ncbi:hypothetical protein M0802_012916, partial [Mischocyttarus mexicanus]